MAVQRLSRAPQDGATILYDKYGRQTINPAEEVKGLVTGLQDQGGSSGSGTIAYGGFFGVGSDGDYTVTSTTEFLTENKHYRNLTVPVGKTLYLSGAAGGTTTVWALRISGILTLNGTISLAGNDGAAAVAGLGYTTGATNSYGADSGTGGTGQVAGGGVGAGTAEALGGAGGVGGSGTTGAGGAAGAAVDPFSYQGGRKAAAMRPSCLTARTHGYSASASLRYQGGGGGGGGGGATGVVGGGGGSGGASMFISCQSITGSGTLLTKGGDGADGGTVGGGLDSGGGAGGGGGGLVFVGADLALWSGTVNYSGGTGGAAGGAAATAGASGVDGEFYNVYIAPSTVSGGVVTASGNATIIDKLNELIENLKQAGFLDDETA